MSMHHNVVRHTRSVLAAHSLEAADFRRPPDAKLRRLWRELLCWDALDNGLQALRFALLLLHVYARLRPPRTTFYAIVRPISYALAYMLSRKCRIALSRGLLIASEGVANVRRVALLALWMLTCSKELRMRLRESSQGDSVSDEPIPFVERVAIGGEVVAHLGELFDVLAFFTGSGLFWRAFGLSVTSELPPWLQRRRRGLERVGVFVSLGALALQQYALHLRRASIQRHIHGSIHRLQQELVPIAGGAVTEPSSRDETPERYRRMQEQYALLVAVRRRMCWLIIERICLYSDALFTTVEALAPDEDKVMLEASTGLVAAVLRLLRLWNEVRFGSLDL